MSISLKIINYTTMETKINNLVRLADIINMDLFYCISLDSRGITLQGHNCEAVKQELAKIGINRYEKDTTGYDIYMCNDYKIVLT